MLWKNEMEIPKRREGNPWEISFGRSNYHGSSDVSLFLSSFPVLRHEKLNYTDPNHAIQSVENATSNLQNLHKDVEAKISLDDLQLQFIGNLLPDDEDDLLAGITDDFDLSDLPSQIEDLEEDDVFGSRGGFEYDFDPAERLSVAMARTNIIDGYMANGTTQCSLQSGGAVAGEHPYGEHPSRTLFVRNINSNVEDSELKVLFEQYGDIRTLYTTCKHRGFVMISYYDIRDARNAKMLLQNRPLRRRKLDIHFSIPKDNPSDKDINQGTLVVFNLDDSVTNDDLRQIFGKYGEVKEIRETPHKHHHKFIEFYDVRAAEAALRALNRSDIAGKRIKLEPSRPGGARRNLMQQLNQELEQDDTRMFRHQLGSPIASSSPAGSWGQFSSPGDSSPLQALSQSPTFGAINHISVTHSAGLASIVPPPSKSIKIPPIGKDRGVNHLDRVLNASNSAHRIPFQQSHSFPENSSESLTNMTSTRGSVSSFDLSSTGASVGTLSGPQYLWGSPTLYSEQARPTSRPGTSCGNSFTPNGHGAPYPNPNSSFITSQSYHGHHVGSAPSGVPLERRFGYFPESPETSYLNPGAFGGLGFNINEGSLISMSSHAAVNPSIGLPGNIFENASTGFRMLPSQRFGHMFLSGSQYSDVGSSGIEGLIERGRNMRGENNGSQIDSKRQYPLELDKIISGEDNRTTLMIKNIPNKYTSKMLLAAIDENHKGTYDFFYLPIDFKNKCNVGYAFINMVSAARIAPFYEAFNGKKWEEFNSEKVASLAYARIQGKAALIAHFQNSSLMNEDKRCRPILFNSEGPDAGDQEPFPLANDNIQVREMDDVPSQIDSSENHRKDSFEESKKKILEAALVKDS